MKASVDAELIAAAGGDAARLAELQARIAAGEPRAYVLGYLQFRGRRFRCDSRAYITDPEAAFLIDTVLAQGDALARQIGRPLRVLDFGVGAGTLALSVKLERPSWSVTGLDIDAAALALAAENAQACGAELECLLSDFLDGWPPRREPPDLLFADPPWGDAQDLYDGERGADYYRQMPAASAFPRGGRSGIHDELLRRVVAARWPSRIVLNYGVLPREVIEQSAAPLADWRVHHPRPGISVLIGHAWASPAAANAPN